MYKDISLTGGTSVTISTSMDAAQLEADLATQLVDLNTREIYDIITKEQKAMLPSRLALLRKSIPALFISLPGDEEKFGGCLAAGRGFAHISAAGNLEPCPFAPFSDMNLREKSLKEILGSPFMNRIRKSHRLLGEANGGCTLWENREWVQSHLQSTLAQPA